MYLYSKAFTFSISSKASWTHTGFVVCCIRHRKEGTVSWVHPPKAHLTSHPLTHRFVFCSLCRAADRHQRANQWSGPGRHPLPRLPHLCNEGSLPRHRRSPCAQGAGSKWPLKRSSSTWIQLHSFAWHLDLKATVPSSWNRFWLVGKRCQTAAEQGGLGKCQAFEVCLLLVPTFWVQVSYTWLVTTYFPHQKLVHHDVVIVLLCQCWDAEGPANRSG